MEETPSRRAVYRVVYPETERPSLSVESGDHAVLDCSELGLRYEAPEDHFLSVGDRVQGRLRFRRGVELEVQGEVVRVQDGAIAVWFDPASISFGEMIAEQRYLRDRGYPPGED
jgi:hypothetical protein